MTAKPQVAAHVVAQAIEAAPDRVRRRLDRSPTAAADWEWKQQPDGWIVETGGETVRLPRQQVQDIGQVHCSCLLAPNCFHILACLSSLEVCASSVESNLGEQGGVVIADEASNVEDAATETVQPSEKQRRAAAEIAKSLAQLLQVGVANAGVVVQSGLLRAVHHCRTEGLHRAAAGGLRVIAGISQVRSRSAESDPAQLAEDAAGVLEVAQHILSEPQVANYWLGSARRKQHPVQPRKLHGLFAEPIVTRSGYAGATVYFLGEDDQFYTASEVRPGDARLARDGYRGGIEIGSMIQPARQLARSRYLGPDLTASRDGRLGRGKSIKIVDQGASSWQDEAIQSRFRRPLLEQWNRIYAQAELPEDARSAGWDLVFVTGKVLGALGPELLLQLSDEEHTIRLAIENENGELFFRSNLKMLSCVPAIELQIVARINLADPLVVYPLAFTQCLSSNPETPRLNLPTSLGGRVFLGFDEIECSHLANPAPAHVALGDAILQPADDPLAALRRRWVASLLSGSPSQRQARTNTIASETASLLQRGFATGAALLESLARSATAADTDRFLATAIYLRGCQYELAKSRASTRL